MVGQVMFELCLRMSTAVWLQWQEGAGVVLSMLPEAQVGMRTDKQARKGTTQKPVVEVEVFN